MVVTTSVPVSGISTVYDFGHHGSSRQLAKRRIIKAIQDLENVTYEKEVKELHFYGVGKQRVMKDMITIFRCVIGCCRVERNKLFLTSTGGATRTSMLNYSKKD